MSAIEALRRADTLLIGDIFYRVQIPSYDPWVGSARPGCKAKGHGLAFDLNAGDFGLPDIPLRFQGTADRDERTVTWAVNEHPDQWFEGVLHVSRIHGQIVTAVDVVSPPSLARACNGEPLVVQSSLALLISSDLRNELVVEYELLFVPDAARVSILLAGAEAGEPSTSPRLGLRIVPGLLHDSGCRRYGLVGDTIRLTAIIDSLMIDGSLQEVAYRWEIAGANPHGPTNRQNLEVFLDRPGQVDVVVHITVSTNLATVSQRASLRIAALTPQQALLEKALCRLRHVLARDGAIVARGTGGGVYLKGQRYVDPLWDPSPELRVLSRPYTTVELNRLEKAIGRLAQAANAVQEQTSIYFMDVAGPSSLPEIGRK